MSALAQEPCRQLCAWSRTERTNGALPVFACAGCGSEWVRSEAWTPRQHDGSVPADVTAEAAQRGRPEAEALTSAHGAASADSAGR